MTELTKFEKIKFLDSEANKIVEAIYQGTSEKFGLFVKRLDNQEVQYIQEDDVITSSIVDKELETFKKDFDMKKVYVSHFHFLLKLQQETRDFLRSKVKLHFEILERNWVDAFESVSAYKVPDGANKYGNSASISIKKSDIPMNVYNDLQKVFKIHDYDEGLFYIYNIFLALEILSNRVNN